MTINRRNFLTISGSTVLGSIIAGYSFNRYLSANINLDFPIEVIDNPKIAHLVKKSDHLNQSYPIKTLNTKTVIIGSGVAGLTAADNLSNRDFIICDSLNRIGGSAASYALDSYHFPTGAHYIPEYPTSFDETVLAFLQKKKIIDESSRNGKYEFTDKEYYVDSDKMQLAQYKGQFYTDSEMPFHQDDAQSLYQLFSPYFGEMQLPSRHIKKEHRTLNQISLKDFIENHSIKLNSQSIDLINYRMRDDYGDTYDQVNALAGLTHYAGRPIIENVSYLTLSPPQGNGFFASKIASNITADQFKLNHTALHISEKDKKYETLLIDENQQLIQINSENIIYAANKHTLKYVYPKYGELFKDSVYSPWLVIGFLVSTKKHDLYWQNEIVDADDHLMGFAIEQAKNNQGVDHDLMTFSVYYNFPPEKRAELLKVIEQPQFIVNKTIEHIEQHTQMKIRDNIKKCFIKAHGHGMAICKPNFLFNDRNEIIKNTHFAFAGCDNGRLPLFFEAVDSGLVAADIINQNKGHHV